MKGRARFRLGEKPPDESTDNAANNPEQGRFDQSHGLCPGHDGTRDQTDNETNNDVPNNV
jgi:hypothetical protein